MNDPKTTTDRKVFNNSKDLGDWYDKKYIEMGDGWHTPVEEVNQHLDRLGVPFDKSKWLLDVGCGAGHFLQEAIKRVKCVGLELSNVGLDHCMRRAPESILVNGDMATVAWLYDSSGERILFDYIVSIGSLEHIVDLPSALNNIRSMLKDDGAFYFYCPNELWMHFDQPNEQTRTDKGWADLFEEHGLITRHHIRLNDNTAFFGDKFKP